MNKHSYIIPVLLPVVVLVLFLIILAIFRPPAFKWALSFSLLGFACLMLDAYIHA